MQRVTHLDVAAAMARIAPPGLAEEWDNTGLLVEPAGRVPVERVLLTVDLTEPVLAEARAGKCRMILAYHPPLFRPLKRLRWDRPGERVLLQAVKWGIVIYSPHTSLDAAAGGVNDWLAAGVGSGKVEPLAPRREEGLFKLVVFVPPREADRLRKALADLGAGVIGDYSHCSFHLAGKGTFLGGAESRPARGRRGRLEEVEEVRLEMVCPREAVDRLPRVIAAHHPYEEPAWDLYPLAGKPLPGAGLGRSVTLARPLTVAGLVRRLAGNLGLQGLRTALPENLRGGARVGRVALCAGAGEEAFRSAPSHPVYFTGEMKHHDLLAHRARGEAVILAGHSESERGYLPILGRRLEEELGGGVVCRPARSDRPPLR